MRTTNVCGKWAVIQSHESSIQFNRMIPMPNQLTHLSVQKASQCGTTNKDESNPSKER